VTRALLCICPPYPAITPPAGAAALLGYLNARGIDDFGFLDLRLGTPNCYEPTYSATGVFGESFVMDVPDLPLILQLLASTDDGEAFSLRMDQRLHRYCLERGVSPTYLASYVAGLNRYYERAFAAYDAIDFVGFTVWTSNLFSTLLAAHHLKRRAVPPFIVAGGPQLTESAASAALGLRGHLFDAVATGEGEETLYALYTAFCESGRQPVIGIGGTKHLDTAGRAIVSVHRPLLKIDALPLPRFDDMAVDAYQLDDDRTLPFQLSRGCTDKCTFCTEWVFWERYRLGASAAGAESVRQLQARYGATYIAFTDSLLNGSEKRIIEFAEALLQQGTRISWGGFMRAQMSDDIARLLYRAGCREVFIGIESFDDETLAAMNKRRTEADNIAALRAFLRAGVSVVAGFVPGFPTDSRSGFLHSAERMRDLQAEFPGRLSVNTEPFRVSPGQPLYRRLEESGLHGKSWADEYLDIAPRYRDVTEGILCSVEGASQGLERIGRERIAFMISTDAPVRTDKFDYDEDEDVSIHEFTAHHLCRGWQLARIKSDAAVIHALIVSTEELDELEEATVHARHAGLQHAAVAMAVTNLMKRHIHARPAGCVPLPHPRFTETLHPSDRIQLSPFVVVRQTDWRNKRQVLVANFVNKRLVRRPAAEASIFAQLAAGPIRVSLLTAPTVEMDAAQRWNALRVLHATGVVIVVHDRVPVHRPERELSSVTP
jgi:radical SAM superfamily enzyme YgiQ (UPF0313 family)